MKLKEILGFKKTVSNCKIKRYIFGIPFVKVKWDTGDMQIFLLGLKILKFKLPYYQDSKNLKELQENDSKYQLNKAVKILNFRNPETKNKKIAIFSVLPPETTGVAHYTYKTHIVEQDKYDIFSDIKTFGDYDYLLDDGRVSNVFPLSFYDKANEKEKYGYRIFVLGNSWHHRMILEEAIKSKGDENRALYLHETLLTGLFKATRFWRIFIKEWYPEYLKDIDTVNSDTYNFAMSNNVFGIRALINLTGIRKIFVNNERAKDLIQAELTPEEYEKLNIEVMFLPVEEIVAEKKDLSKGKYKYVVASFGVPGKSKLSDAIVEAIILLNKKFNNAYKLIICGYEANKIDTKDCDFIEIVDSPETDHLYTLMNSVDLAIQLRPNPHGESSGCVSQLLGLGQNILTSNGFVAKDQEQYCHLVNGVVSVEELAKSIENSVSNKKNYDSMSIIKEYSFRALSEKLYSYLRGNIYD
ncbi:glycosyltransferase [bacterium]|nr:glycosyltransferase [bacterium]